jgi:hypothetical protein
MCCKEYGPGWTRGLPSDIIRDVTLKRLKYYEIEAREVRLDVERNMQRDDKEAREVLLRFMREMEEDINRWHEDFYNHFKYDPKPPNVY